jgi:hypothetical protein
VYYFLCDVDVYVFKMCILHFMICVVLFLNCMTTIFITLTVFEDAAVCLSLS